MLRLRPYKPCDAQTIVTWLKSETAFRQWCADRHTKYPLAAETLNAYYDRDKNNLSIWGMTAFDDTGVIGHFTMRFPYADFSEIRLGFVIIDDEKQGKGIEKEMVSLALRYAFGFVRVKKVSLGVFENNPAAIHCYRSCGFRAVPLPEPEHYHCMGEIWNCIEMECTPEDLL